MCIARPTRRLPMVHRIPSGNSGSRGSRDPGERHPRLMPRLRGFTFVELMVVITIIVVLITIAIPIYNKSVIRAKESVLHNNLFTIRTVIDNYTYDKQKAPQTLQDLVTDGYLREVPF